MKKAPLYFPIFLLLLFCCTNEPEILAPSNDRDLIVFPNPCIDRVNMWVSNYGNQNYVLTVFDSKGKEIAKETFPPGTNIPYSVSMIDRPEGIYHASIDKGNTTVVVEFLKIQR